MNAISKPIPTMQQAQGERHVAVAARGKLTARLKLAETALTGAIAARDAMVAKVAAGGAVTAQESRNAEAAIRDAETERALVVDALAIPDAAVAASERKVKLLNQVEWQREYIRAAETRISLADEIDLFGEQLSEWLVRWNASAELLNASWSHGLNGRGPLPHEIEAIRSEHEIYCFIPIPMQTVLIRQGSIHHQSVAGRTRGVWLAGMQDARQKIAGFEDELSR